jgi:hypothetical protein
MSNELSVVERRQKTKLENEFKKCEQADFESAVRKGQILQEILENKYYREECGTFAKYVKKTFDLNKSQAYSIAAAAKVVDILSATADISAPTSIHQCKALAKVEDSQDMVKVWKQTVEKAEELGRKPSKKLIEKTTAELLDEYEYIEKDENEPLEDGEIDCGLVEETPEVETGFCKCQVCDGTGQVKKGEFDSKFEEVWAIVRAAGKKTRIADSGRKNSKKAYEKAIKAISTDGIEDDNGQTVTVSDPHGFFKMRIQLFVSSIVGQGEFCPQFTTLVSREFWNQDDERWNEGNSKDLFVDSVGGVY